MYFVGCNFAIVLLCQRSLSKHSFSTQTRCFVRKGFDRSIV